MIVANNTLSGFQGIVGTLTIHIAMAISMFWVEHDFDEGSPYENLKSLWYYCFFLHVYLVGVVLLSFYVR